MNVGDHTFGSQPQHEKSGSLFGKQKRLLF